MYKYTAPNSAKPHCGTVKIINLFEHLFIPILEYLFII